MAEPDDLQPASTTPPVCELTDEQLIRVAAYVAEQVAEAREDPVAFFNVVARDHLQRPLRALPHQELAIRFIDAYQRSCLRMPTGTGKTFILRYHALWRLGRSHESYRGAFLSASQDQAKGPVDEMRRLIEESPQVQAVFPELAPSGDPMLPWRPDRFTVRRPPGLPDPSMVALGMDAKIPGRRWSDCYCDDILDDENTRTKEAREALYLKFDTQVVSRLDPQGYKFVVSNTPWDRDDITYSLEEQAGFPTLSMGIDGRIRFGGDPRVLGDPEDLFGDLIRPSPTMPGYYRLRGHDPDPTDTVPLFPELFTRQWIAEHQPGGPKGTIPHAWARTRLCEPLDAGSARCQREWVKRALERGSGLPWPCPATPGVSRRFTGVDVGGTKRGDDLSSICTIEVLQNEHRRILNLQSGHWTGPELRDRILAEHERYDTTFFVESNGAQKYFRDFAEEKSRGVRIVNFHTGMNKHDVLWGVEHVFAELQRGIWIWPSSSMSVPPPELDELGYKECVFYSPAAHTGDRLMALFLARQGIKVSTSRSAGRGRGKLLTASGGGF